ncbi:hypothetical protein NDU88_002200, partial [Pleurodeles waltl]
KERHHRRESPSRSSKSHRRHRDSRRRHESRRRSSRECSRSRSPSARSWPTWGISPTVSPPPTSPASPTPPLSVYEVEPHQELRASPEQKVPVPSSASPPAPVPQSYPAFPAPGTDPTAFFNAMFNIFATMVPGGGHAGPSDPLAFNLGAPAPYKPTPFIPFLPSGGTASAPMPLVSPRRLVMPTTSTVPAPMDSPRIQSTVKLPVAAEGPASDGSEDQRRRRSSALADALSTLGLESRLRSRRLALRLLEEEEYERQHLEEGEIVEPSGDLHGLDMASGLDTSPEWDLASPGEYREEAASFHAVVRNAADFLDLPLPAVEVKRNLLTEVLHPASAVAEPLLPFNEALLDPIKDIWKKPVTSAAVNRRYRVAPGDPDFLTKPPTPESLVVQASCSSRSAPGSFPGAPADRESKKMDQAVKNTFSSCSMALKSTNVTCILGHYMHALMDEAKGHPGLSQEVFNLLSDAEAAATQVIQSGLDASDSVARAMGTSIVLRRQAWLRSSGFSTDVQTTLLDLPFDGDKLFGAKVDSALERFKESSMRQDNNLQEIFLADPLGAGVEYALEVPPSSTLPLPPPPEGCSRESSLSPPPLLAHTSPVGGRLTHFLHMWESITSDSWVTGIVEKGYALPVWDFPPPFPPRTAFCSDDHLLLLQQEVMSLLSKGAVALVPEQERGQGCYSRYFLIPKKDGWLRPILDLRILNWFLKQEKFKMLTLSQVLLALNEGDWMVSVDLQDAYFHIPILKSHRKYLRFVVGLQHYQFAVLPFGLTSALQVFLKVMAVVAAELRRKGIAVFPYLDDWLIKAKSPELLRCHRQSTTQLLFDLGFSVNVPKSHLEPSKRLLFIGAVLTQH